MNLFAKRLKELRKEKNLLQAELGKQFGVGRTTITSWEGGNSEPNFDMLIAIADFFEVPIDYLLGRTDY